MTDEIKKQKQKDYIKKWQQSPKGKASSKKSDKKRNGTLKRKLSYNKARKKYNKSLKGITTDKEYKKKYRELPTTITYMKQYRKSTKGKISRNKYNISNKAKQTQKIYYKNNLQKIKENQQQYYIKNTEYLKQQARKWRKENPRSSKQYSLELQESMNNVRLRDKNTCQWFNCGLKYREAEIHVHHIFPRNEYPELELIEQYMICYCANHHGLFHRYRGDWYSEMISSRNSIGTNPIILGDNP